MVPALSGLLGLIVKIISNIILLQIPEIGVNGAAIASNLNNIIVFIVSYKILTKTIKLNLRPMKFVIKPLIATAIMSISSFTLYKILAGVVLPEKIATTISLIFAVIIYALSIIALKIFTKEEITMIPYGTKLCKILEKLGVYGKEAKN